jgi:hypothetical protein
MKLSISRRFIVLMPLLLASLAPAACSSDNANPGPTVFDSGADVARSKQPDSTAPDAPGKVDTGATQTPDGTAPPSHDAGVDALPFIEAGLPDVGVCTSDAATCNSCYTPAQNPLNGCSAAAANCIPFDNTRVPVNAP